MAAENTPEQLISHARDLVAEFQSVLMATSSVDGVPEVSYSPHVIIDGLLYVFLSDLSVHTGNLKANPRASLLFIEDEAGCGNLHARRRVTYRVSAEKLARDDPRFEPVLAAMQDRFGKIMTVLKSLPDFHLFGFSVDSATLVRGFADAHSLECDSF